LQEEHSKSGARAFSPSTIGSDLLASVVVFLVALPLCMGIAIASGVEPAQGIISGVIGGIVAGGLAGSPLQVSGPAAGLAVVVLELIREHGIANIGIIIFLAGIIQIIAGFSRIAPWFRAVPPAVINGMLSGIGVLIFVAQFHVMVDDSPKGSGLNNLLSIPMAVYKGLNWWGNGASEANHHIAATIGVITILLLLVWQKFARGRMKTLPGSLIAVVIASSVAFAFKLPVNYVTIPADLFNSVEFSLFKPGGLSFSWEIFFDAVAVAFIAAAETLLTCAALDKMHSGSRTNFDKELISQGIGNSLCGFLGALPITGVMVRSGVNVNAGAKTRASSMMHGFWILLIVMFLPHVLEYIPVSSLAALLVFTGYKMINWKFFKEIKSFGRSEAFIYVATIMLIVSVDLLTGVLAGIALSILKLIYIFSHLEIAVTTNVDLKRTNISLKGAATFLSLPRLADAIDAVQDGYELHIHLESLEYIDHACLDMLVSWDKQHRAKGGVLAMDWGTLDTVFKERRRAGRSFEGREFRAQSEVHEDVDVDGADVSDKADCSRGDELLDNSVGAISSRG
jgi:MFS superfamily sulfate permease-like transporter